MAESSVTYHFFLFLKKQNTKTRAFVSVSVSRASEYTVFCRAENDVNFFSIWLIDIFLFVPAILQYEPSSVVSIFQIFSLNCSYHSDKGCMTS